MDCAEKLINELEERHDLDMDGLSYLIEVVLFAYFTEMKHEFKRKRKQEL